MQELLEKLEPIWIPHPGQLEFLDNQAKIKVLACGRRWGKTDACAVSILAALYQERPTRHLILAPTIGQATLLFERVVELLRMVVDGTGDTYSVATANPGPLASVIRFFTAATRTPRFDKEFGRRICEGKIKPTWTPHPILKFRNHKLTARSGHVGRWLRGMEATHIVVDEAAYVPEALITEVAMPMLATTEGHLTMISTPRGQNHFWRFYQMGQAHEHGVWSRRAPTSESPHVPKAFLDVQRELISERAFAVEYEAEFMDAEGALFSTEAVEGCLTERLVWNPDLPICIGVDWGRLRDFTAVAVVSGTRHQATLVEIERFNHLSWTAMAARVARMAERYPHAKVVCDATGSGDGALEQLRKELPNYSVTGCTFTAPVKARLLDALAWAFERRALRMAPNTELLRELQHFETVVSDSGNTKFGAQSGYHDDMVIALALAVCELPTGAGSGIVLGKSRRFFG